MELSCSTCILLDLFRQVSLGTPQPRGSSDLCHSVLPGIAFSLDLIETTHQYGVSEVLLSSFLAAFVFSVFGAQPLTIAGVTGLLCDRPFLHLKSYLMKLGPVTVFNRTIYAITQRGSNPPTYLSFIGWVYLWAAIFHWITALLNCKSSMLWKYYTLMLPRVQLSQIRDTLFLRHLRLLRHLGLPSVWYSDHYPPARECGGGFCLYHPRPAYVGHVLPPKLVIQGGLFPPSRKTIFRRLRNADFAHCQFCSGVLGKVLSRETDHLTSERCLSACR